MKRIVLILIILLALIVGCAEHDHSITFSGNVTQTAIHTGYFTNPTTTFTLDDGPAIFTVNGYYPIPIGKPYTFTLRPDGNRYEVIYISEYQAEQPKFLLR